MEQTADYIEALIHQLELSDPEPTAGESLDLRAAVRRMTHMLRAVMREGQELQLAIAEGCYVRLGEQSLRQLLLNLVANGRDAMADDGTCRLEVQRDDAEVAITVSDNGCGIPTEVQARIFEPFYSTKGPRGMGLGLSSAARTMEACGGKLSLWSESGQGTRIALRFPAASLPLEMEAPQEAAHQGRRAARVLLAEDEPLVREVLRSGLQRAGYDVVAAEHGDAALALLAAEDRFDVLCTDAVMPGLPTHELIAQFSRSYPRSSVIVISGYLPSDLNAALLGDPRVTFMHKPFATSALVATIERALSTPRDPATERRAQT